MIPSSEFSLEAALANWRADIKTRTAVEHEIIAELETHLREAVIAGMERGETPETAFATAVKNLGAAVDLDREFQRVPSHWQRWIAARFSRARMLKIARQFATVVVLVLVVRQFLVLPMYAASNGLSPEVPQGSRFLVWRLSAEYRSGDVVVYLDEGRNFLGRVVEANAHLLKVSRADTPVENVDRDRVIGRVIATTR